MKTCRILCVCGSGTVSSNMVANKLRDQLGEAGWDCTTVETSPGGVETELMGNKYDIIACVSPVYQDYDIPKVIRIVRKKFEQKTDQRACGNGRDI